MYIATRQHSMNRLFPVLGAFADTQADVKDIEVYLNTWSYNISSYTNKLEGWTYGIGSKTMLTNNVYLTVEGTYTEFDTLSATTTDSESNTNTGSAKPKVAQATIGLGYKF